MISVRNRQYLRPSRSGHSGQSQERFLCSSTNQERFLCSSTNQGSPRRELTKESPISVAKHNGMRQQFATDTQDSGAHVLNDFSRITAPSLIFFFTDKIRKPFLIEWCRELPPHDRSFPSAAIATCT